MNRYAVVQIEDLERAQGLELLRAEQRRIGGQVVFLEHEKDNTFLRSFYETNGFHSFGHRTSETDGETYGQMFAFVRQKKDAG